jgi:hypothetical protein
MDKGFALALPRRGSTLALATVLILLGSASSASAVGVPKSGSPHYQDQVEARGFEVLGHLDLRDDLRYGDIFFFDHGPDVGAFAYVGTSLNFEDPDRPCGRGVKIFDVSRPTQPRLVATAAGVGRDVDYEDLTVARIGARVVLAVGIQACVPEAPTGLVLYDVTDPTSPEKLSFLSTPPRGIHELDMVVRPDGRALVLATVPHSEREGTGGDVRIIEVTDPEHPVEIATWGILRDSSLPVVGGNFEITDQDAGIGAYASNLAHGMRAADGGMTVYVSHWDAGVIRLDISDPAHPRLVGRTTFEVDEDGDAHSAAIYEANGTRYILQNNEEISPLSPPVITSSATGDRQLPGLENHFMPTPLSSIGVTTGEVFDANDACEASDFNGARGKIALFDTGTTVGCRLGGQVIRAIRSTAKGFLINFLGTARPTFFRLFLGPRAGGIVYQEGTDIPSAMFSQIDGGAEAIRAQLASGPVTVTMTPTEPSLGFLEVFNETNPTSQNGVLEYPQVGEFSGLRHVVGDPNFRRGWFTIHNTETMGQRAYCSWYANGIIALDISDPTSPVVVGKVTPRVNGPAQMWGVALDPGRGLAFGSDIRTGLWIFRPTGDAAP